MGGARVVAERMHTSTAALPSDIDPTLILFPPSNCTRIRQALKLIVSAGRNRGNTVHIICDLSLSQHDETKMLEI